MSNTNNEIKTEQDEKASAPAPDKEDNGNTQLTPEDLVRMYKETGRFDQLRKALMNEFDGQDRQNFDDRLGAIIMERLKDVRLPVWSRTETHEEVMRELERHTVYERMRQHVNDNILSDHKKSVEVDLNDLIQQHRSEKKQPKQEQG